MALRNSGFVKFEVASPAGPGPDPDPYPGSAPDPDDREPAIPAYAEAGTVRHPTQHGWVVLEPNGHVMYQPRRGFIGLDRFDYRATDGAAGGASNPAGYTIEVRAPNGQPLAVNDVVEAFRPVDGPPDPVIDVYGLLANDRG